MGGAAIHPPCFGRQFAQGEGVRGVRWRVSGARLPGAVRGAKALVQG